jgi:hypothetical protein
MVDGVIQIATPENVFWTKRTGKGVPSRVEPEAEVVIDTTDRRTDWEIIEGLEEHLAD